MRLMLPSSNSGKDRWMVSRETERSNRLAAEAWREQGRSAADMNANVRPMLGEKSL